MGSGAVLEHLAGPLDPVQKGIASRVASAWHVCLAPSRVVHSCGYVRYDSEAEIHAIRRNPKGTSPFRRLFALSGRARCTLASHIAQKERKPIQNEHVHGRETFLDGVMFEKVRASAIVRVSVCMVS